MTLVERLRAALAPGDHAPILLAGDTGGDGDPAGTAPAAVLVAITDRPDPGLILTLRTETLRRHAGQIAFPGGRIDPDDDGPIGAALREAHEEIALDPALVTLVGTADPYRTVSGYEVTPVLGVIPPDLAFIPAPDEVALVFELPLAFALDEANHVEATVEWQGRDRHYYEFDWNGHRVWGATAAMLINLSRRLRWTA